MAKASRKTFPPAFQLGLYIDTHFRSYIIEISKKAIQEKPVFDADI